MQRKKILLVDDSATSLLLEKMILKATPHELLTASDGEEAISRATAERPDLILLDVVMPGRDGFDVCRALRAQDETREIPIIMVTTRGEGANVDKGFSAGCNDYVTKPFNSNELLGKVEQQLTR